MALACSRSIGSLLSERSGVWFCLHGFIAASDPQGFFGPAPGGGIIQSDPREAARRRRFCLVRCCAYAVFTAWIVLLMMLKH